MAELVFTPITAADRCAIDALQRVTYLPGSWPKRFARSLAWIAKDANAPGLTDKMRIALWRQVVRFRRQIADKSLVAYAENIVAAADKEEASHA